MKQRLFIAVSVPENIKKDLLAKISLPPGFKITRPENLHITVLFLGDTPEEEMPEIIRLLEKSLSDQKCFDLAIDSFGQFPERGFPAIIFVTGKNGKAELINLAGKIREPLEKIGFKDNKPFKYHITVARNKFREKAEFKPAQIPVNYTFKVAEVILYKSDLQPAGPVYSALKVIKLKS